MNMYVNADKLKIDKINGKRRGRVLRLIFEFAPSLFFNFPSFVFLGEQTHNTLLLLSA